MLNLMYYSQSELFRKPTYFANENWLKTRLNKRNTRIVPVWKNLSLILGHEKPTAVTLSGNHAHGLLEVASEIAFLGVDGSDVNDNNANAYFAVDVSECETPSLAAMMGPAKFTELRQVSTLMERHEASLLALA